MKELVLNGRTYLSTKRAAEITGYTTDYVGQLARGGKIDAQLVGRNWYIDEDSITKHKFGEAKVSLRKEQEAETPAPALEVLVDSAEEEDDEIEKTVVEEEEVASEIKEEAVNSSLEDIEDVWQEWYRAQKTVPAEEEEVFIRKIEDEASDATEEVEAPQEEVVPITRVREVSRPQLEEVAAPEEEKAPIASPVQLPAKRSWGGTGLVLAAVLTIVFVGGLAVGAEYILVQNPDLPMASVYQGFKDYLLGIQRIK